MKHPDDLNYVQLTRREWIWVLDALSSIPSRSWTVDDTGHLADEIYERMFRQVMEGIPDDEAT